MTKTEELKKLFDKWKRAQKNESDDSCKKTMISSKIITKDFFTKDGIIDEKRYNKQKTKVLFISNESNIEDHCDPEGSHTFDRNEDFIYYCNNKEDEWSGKMRERICSLYMVISNNYDVQPYELAKDFAFINLNKRGGGNNIGNGKHIVEYCKKYEKYIREEIDIIKPDLIVWLGCDTFDLNIHIDYLGAQKEDGKVFIKMGRKKIPIIRMFHTSTRNFGGFKPSKKFDNKIIGKLASKLEYELNRI